MARTAIHPGQHLAEQLGALEMSAAELARKLRVPANRITEIMNGQRAITGDTALRLGLLSYQRGILAKFEAIYDLRAAEQKSGDAIKTLPTFDRPGRKVR